MQFIFGTIFFHEEQSILQFIHFFQRQSSYNFMNVNSFFVLKLLAMNRAREYSAIRKIQPTRKLSWRLILTPFNSNTKKMGSTSVTFMAWAFRVSAQDLWLNGGPKFNCSLHFEQTTLIIKTLYWFPHIGMLYERKKHSWKADGATILITSRWLSKDGPDFSTLCVILKLRYVIIISILHWNNNVYFK